LRSTEGINPVRESFSEVMPLDETAKYLKKEEEV